METWSCIDGRWQRGDREDAQLRWFHVSGGAHEELETLAERFGLHPLAIEDCLSPLIHPPKIDEFGDHLFIVVLALNGDDVTATEEVDVFLGRTFLITYADTALPEIEAARRVLDSGIQVRSGPDGLLYELADRLVDGILPEINQLSDRLDGIENEVLKGSPGPSASHQVVELRAQAGQVRRMFGPQLTLFQRLSRGEFSYISDPNRVYFRDIYDHMVRVDLALEAVREDAEVVLSTYLSALNNRMNEVMKVLSVVAALALPANVISGVFGTNFDNVPGLHSNWGFIVMLTGMASLAIGMALYFRRRGWF